jgi:putative alpha-1,2-mannosidase
MLGIYPNAGQDYYYIASPTFTKVRVRLGNGRSLVISAPEASKEQLYVSGARLNGKPWQKAWIRHGDIAKGGELRLQMSRSPSRWGSETPPPSLTPPQL